MASETSTIKSNAAISAIKTYKEPPFVKHQWEELMQHLYQMNDPLLRTMVNQEMKLIRENDPGFKLR